MLDNAVRMCYNFLPNFGLALIGVEPAPHPVEPLFAVERIIVVAGDAFHRFYQIIVWQILR